MALNAINIPTRHLQQTPQNLLDTLHLKLTVSQNKPPSLLTFVAFQWPPSLEPFVGTRNRDHLQPVPPLYYYIQSHPTPVTSTCRMSLESILSLASRPPIIIASLVAAIASQLMSLHLSFLPLIHSPDSSLSN